MRGRFCHAMKKVFDKGADDAFLREAGLIVTNQRRRIWKLIAGRQPVSIGSLIRKMQGTAKTTVYAVLRALEANGLIYKIVSPAGTAYYALCPPGGSRPDSYLHKYCPRCKKIYGKSLPGPSFPDLPGGFRAERFITVVKKTCRRCKAKYGR